MCPVYQTQLIKYMSLTNYSMSKMAQCRVWISDPNSLSESDSLFPCSVLQFEPQLFFNWFIIYLRYLTILLPSSCLLFSIRCIRFNTLNQSVPFDGWYTECEAQSHCRSVIHDKNPLRPSTVIKLLGEEIRCSLGMLIQNYLLILQWKRNVWSRIWRKEVSPFFSCCQM